jgi:DNA-binding MarR family transcriptional regulator
LCGRKQCAILVKWRKAAKDTNMMRDDEALAARVRAALEAQRAVMQAMHGASTPDWAHLDLSMGQLKALVALATAGDMNVSELANWLKTSKPSASILVDRLVHLGYVERMEDRDDRRRTLVMLSATGRELVARLQRSGGEQMEGWMAQLSPEDLAALTQGLWALAAVVSREVASGDAGGGGDAGARSPLNPSARKTGRGTGTDHEMTEE